MCECMCTLYVLYMYSMCVMVGVHVCTCMCVGVHVCMCVYNSQEVELDAHTERCLTPPPHAALFVLQCLGMYS